MSYTLTAGDLLPDMKLNVSSGGAPADLTGAISIDLRWVKPDGTVSTVSLVAIDLATGQLKRVWVSGDTDIAGPHRGRVVVAFPGPRTETYPNDGDHFLWHVYAPLGG